MNMWRAVSQMCVPSKLDRSIWIISPVPCSSCFPGSPWTASTCCEEAAVRDTHVLVHLRPLVPSSGPLQPPFSSLKTPQLPAGELSTSVAYCVISSETGKKKKMNMETRLGWTNERTAWSKLLSLIGWLYCEAIFRSYVTGVYESGNLSTNHLLFCLHALWDT